jgi:hypothetical protein
VRDLVITTPVGEGEDKPVWSLTKNGVFTVKSLHKNWQMFGEIGILNIFGRLGFLPKLKSGCG